MEAESSSLTKSQTEEAITKTSENILEIRKDNVIEAVKEFNSAFNYTLLFLAVLLIISLHGIDSKELNEMEIPFTNLKAQ